MHTLIPAHTKNTVCSTFPVYKQTFDVKISAGLWSWALQLQAVRYKITGQHTNWQRNATGTLTAIRRVKMKSMYSHQWSARMEKGGGRAQIWLKCVVGQSFAREKKMCIWCAMEFWTRVFGRLTHRLPELNDLQCTELKSLRYESRGVKIKAHLHPNIKPPFKFKGGTILITRHLHSQLVFRPLF